MSPRPKKPRNCSCHPGNDAEMVFKPAGIPGIGLERVYLYRDELESLTLCDGPEHLSQTEAGKRMGVSRGTVQRLLSSARGKVADALANGKMVVIGPHSEE